MNKLRTLKYHFIRQTNNDMARVYALFLIAVCAASAVQGSVLRWGREAPITVEMLDTPAGQAFVRHYDQRFIFPGTKWCGNGDNAEDYDDLGLFKETDKCCRDHDYCDDILASGETNHGLTNEGPYTRLNCKCDDAFFNCLGLANDWASTPVAMGYFNLVESQCFAYRHPATCVEWDEIIGNSRCVKWTYDETQPELWQWFDLPKWVLGVDAVPSV